MSNDLKLMKTVSVWEVLSIEIENIIRILFFFSHTMIELIITVLSMIDDELGILFISIINAVKDLRLPSRR
jgi:hypothetical protein